MANVSRSGVGIYQILATTVIHNFHEKVTFASNSQKVKINSKNDVQNGSISELKVFPLSFVVDM
jgi:hypothetical protein